MRLALPGLLVEYLVSGVVASLWLLPLLDAAWPTHPLTDQLLYFAPIAYVLGMVVDFVAFVASYYPKHAIRGYARRRLGARHEAALASGSVRRLRLQLERPELIEEIERRSSRDRIARGTVVNLVALGVVLEVTGVGVSWVLMTGAVLTTALMWSFFEYFSFSFEVRALTAASRSPAAGPDTRPPGSVDDPGGA